MQKVIESLQLIISHQPRPYSSAMNPKGQVLYILRYLGHWGHVGKLGPNSPISLEFLIFIISTSAHLNFISIMGSMNYFSQVIREILQNNYLKNNFENSEFRDFVHTF